MRSKILVAAAVVALGFFAIASSPALAAPGGKGGRSGGTGSEKCWVTPSQVPLSTGYTVNGSGFSQDKPIDIMIQTAAGTVVYFPYVKADGTWSISAWAGAVGQYTVVVETTNRNKTTVLTTCSFAVV